MRCALLGPTPGSWPSSSMRSWTAPSYMRGDYIPGRPRPPSPPASGPIVVCCSSGGVARRVADRGDDEVLEALDVVGVDRLRVDLERHDVAGAGDDGGDEPAAGGAGHLGLGQLALRLHQLLLHLLRLLHQLLHVRLSAGTGHGRLPSALVVLEGSRERTAPRTGATQSPPDVLTTWPPSWLCDQAQRGVLPAHLLRRRRRVGVLGHGLVAGGEVVVRRRGLRRRGRRRGRGRGRRAVGRQAAVQDAGQLERGAEGRLQRLPQHVGAGARLELPQDRRVLEGQHQAVALDAATPWRRRAGRGRCACGSSPPPSTSSHDCAQGRGVEPAGRAAGRAVRRRAGRRALRGGRAQRGGRRPGLGGGGRRPGGRASAGAAGGGRRRAAGRRRAGPRSAAPGGRACRGGRRRRRRLGAGGRPARARRRQRRVAVDGVGGAAGRAALAPRCGPGASAATAAARADRSGRPAAGCRRSPAGARAARAGPAARCRRRRRRAAAPGRRRARAAAGARSCRASRPGPAWKRSAARDSPAVPIAVACRPIRSSWSSGQSSSPVAPASGTASSTMRSRRRSSTSVTNRCGSWPPSMTWSSRP